MSKFAYYAACFLLGFCSSDFVMSALHERAQDRRIEALEKDRQDRIDAKAEEWKAQGVENSWSFL